MRHRIVASFVSVGLFAASLGAGIATAPAAGAYVGRPVLIVAGTVSPEFVLNALESRLESDGYHVYTMTLPGGGLGDIAQSATAVATKVDQIRAATGFAKVDLIGHSQGGLENRYYMKFLGGAAKVGAYVSLGTPQYGAALANLGTFFFNCLGITGCSQMAIGSAFLNNLNAGDDTPGAARYYSIYTINDELVQPYWNAKIYDGATNISLQSYCWWKIVGHVGLVLDGAVYGLVRSALRGGTISTNCFAL